MPSTLRYDCTGSTPKWGWSWGPKVSVVAGAEPDLNEVYPGGETELDSKEKREKN